MAGRNNGNNEGPWGENPWGKNTPPGNDNFDEFIKRGQETLKSLFPGNSGGGKDDNIQWKKLLPTLAIMALLLWGATGIFVIQEGWTGVVLRFGAYQRDAGPGPNYHLPFPIEKVIKVDTETIRSEEIGFRSTTSKRFSRTKQAEQTLLSESLMLTGDENIVDVKLDVQWIIKDAKDFLFNIRDRNYENTVKNAAESAIRDILGKTSYTEAIEGEGRAVIAQGTEELLQETLDTYQAGIQINSIQIKPIDPPEQVIDAFRDVQTARADKEKEINKAEAYQNDIIPRAKGEAEQILQKAEGYKNEVIAQAEGEASRFIAVYNEYKRAKNVTKRRMYLETMESLLEDMEKILIDDNAKGSGVIPFLSLTDNNKRHTQ